MSDLIKRAEATAVLRKTLGSLGNSVVTEINSLPGYVTQAEAVEVVRCRDCKHWDELGNMTGVCHRSENGYDWFGVDATDYCSFGERRKP